MTLRIALFSGNYNYLQDGANRALNRLVGYLEDEMGAEVRVYSPTTSTPAFPPRGTLVSVPSVPFPGRSEYRVALRFPASLRRDIDAFGPDLVHLSAPDPLGYRALRYAKARRLPVVASLHTRFETYLHYYGLGWAKKLAERYLRSFYARCDRVLVPTAAIRHAMLPALGAERVHVWGRGVDAAMFNPRRRSDARRRTWGWGPEQVVVAFFGRLVVEKGTEVFAQAVRILRGRGVAVAVLVIGDGPARTAMERTLPEARFTGMLAGDALAEALASADILINPSVTEAFGNVVLEAMASGLAPVCADVASSRNLVEDGVSGILCAPHLPAAYADAAEALVRDPAKLARVRRTAARASGRFNWPDVLADVVRTYREALLAAGQGAASAPARARGAGYPWMTEVPRT